MGLRRAAGAVVGGETNDVGRRGAEYKCLCARVSALAAAAEKG